MNAAHAMILRASALVALSLAWAGTALATQDILPARDAYRYKATLAEGDVVVRYTIAPGYYLYRDRLGLASTTPGVSLGPLDLPVGEAHEDSYFGKQVIYRGPTTISARVTFDGAPRDFDLELRLQGCADAGLCYPPQRWAAHVTVPRTSAATPAAPEPPKSAGFNLRKLLGRDSPTEGNLLPADRAFVLHGVSSDPDRVTLHWDIADGYYLYRDKLKVSVAQGGAQLGKPSIPGGESKHDDYFGDQTVFFGAMDADVPVAAAAGTRDLALDVVYQGCAEAGLCYPPIHKTLTVRLAAPGSGGSPPDGLMRVPHSAQDVLAAKIRSGSLLAVLATFFGAGLLLAFTPCVLPMVPILSGIIVGAGRERPVSRGRAFALSLAYVLGMAFTYTVAGAAFAAAGRQAQAFFQQPWIIVAFAALFVLLALGMFGVFNLQVPAAFQARVAGMSDRQRQGTLAGTAVMGALSSLIVTACVAPPLVAALAVIGQSGNVFRGGAALFSLSLGMGAPLLLIGASAGRLLPRAGPWMETVKAVFGVIMLGVAVWMLGRVLPAPVTLALWAVIAFVTGYVLFASAVGGAGRAGMVIRRAFGALAVLYGIAMLAGALAGGRDPLRPLDALVHRSGSHAGEQRLALTRIKSVADFDRARAEAVAAGRPLMLDFYADWCVSCKEMEDRTFTDPGVQAVLARAVLLQADVTANDDADQALLARFGILGPPTIVFFAADGSERTDYRVVGFQSADEFRNTVTGAIGGDAS